MNKATNWNEMTIDQVADLNALSIDRAYPYEDIDYVDINSVNNRRITQVKALRLTDAPSRAKRILRDNDILISTVRPNLKHFCFIKNASEKLIASTGFAVISADPKKTNPYYLYSLLTTDTFTQYLSQIAEGHTSAYPSINPSVIADSVFAFPSIDEQEEIAAVLLCLDDKIDLLHKENDTLAKLIEAIFNERFINPTATKEWTVSTVGEVVDHLKQTVHPDKEPFCIFSHYSIPAFDANKAAALEKGSMIMSNKYRVLENTILFSKLNPDTPRVWVVMKPGENAICSTEFQVLKPKDQYYFVFVYALLRFSELAKELASKVQGTSSSHQRLKPSDILGVEFHNPPENILRAFHALTFPFLLKIEENERQILELTLGRDTLLPKLVSGEIRVGVNG